MNAITAALGLASVFVALQPTSADAAESVAGSMPGARCIGIADDRRRLECYDSELKRTAPVQTQAKPAATSAARQPVFDHEPASAATPAGETSLLDRRWELDAASKQGEFHLRAYKPVYLLPAFYTSSVNKTPSSPAPGRTVTTPRDLQPVEAVYQISLKTKLWEDLLGGDLWTGYTQVSHWQIYNGAQSRPFSETNYEPELMYIRPTDYELFGWNGRLLGITADHQSNGRSQPLSRSWNRIMLNLGFERDGWSLILRPWWRVPDSDDDNPDISDYMGRGDLQLVHVWNGHEFALMARHSLRGGDRSHGALQFDWAFPISGDLRGHLQLFDGYGQSLIDYNHRAWYVGVGLSLLEWY